jgi:DNA-binding transcriptional MerR regulator
MATTVQYLYRSCLDFVHVVCSRSMAESGRLRIGELSRRVGVSPELLLAWETRYGLVAPERTAGGLRLYSEADEHRVRVMRREIASGLSAAEAARVALGAATAAVSAEAVLADLDTALATLDEPAAQAALDRAFASMTLAIVVTDVLLPFLRDLGEGWATAERTVAAEDRGLCWPVPRASSTSSA